MPNNVPRQNVPVIDLKTGLMDPSWYRFFTQENFRVSSDILSKLLEVDTNQGLVVQTTGDYEFAKRTLQPPSAGFTIANPAGIAGDPTFALADDLAVFEGLSPSNDDVLQRKAGAWANRTLAQLISDLAALGTTFQPLDSDLTSIAALSTTAFGRGLLALADAAALLAAAGAQPLDTDLTDIAGLTRARGDLIRGNASAWGNFSAKTADTFVGGDGTDVGTRTAAQVLASLAAVGTTFQPLDSDLTTIAGLTATTDNFIQSKSSAWASRTIAQVKADFGLPTSSTDNQVPRFDGTAGALQSSGLVVWDSITLADDNATSISVGTGGKKIEIVTTNSSLAPSPRGSFFVKPDDPTCTNIVMVNTTNITFTTGTLAGTTGTDGNITLSVHTDNKLYIENRSGNQRIFTISWLG